MDIVYVDSDNDDIVVSETKRRFNFLNQTNKFNEMIIINPMFEGFRPLKPHSETTMIREGFLYAGIFRHDDDLWRLNIRFKYKKEIIAFALISNSVYMNKNYKMRHVLLEYLEDFYYYPFDFKTVRPLIQNSFGEASGVKNIYC